MKATKAAALAVLFSGALALCACSSQQGGTSNPNTTAKQQQTYQSYVTQTSLYFPADWSYSDDDGINEGMEATFTLPDGQAAMQFVFMTAEQRKNNNFLESFDDVENVDEEAYKAGPYEGTLLTGDLTDQKCLIFEGFRDWYDTGLQLCLRVYMESGNNTFETQKRNMETMLKSVEVQTDTAADLPDYPQEQWTEYNMMEELGVTFSAPSDWYVAPHTYTEEPRMTANIDIAEGDNTLTVEAATATEDDFEALLKDLKDSIALDGVYNGKMTTQGNTTTMYCLFEGKVNRATIEKLETRDGKVRYLWVSCQLRPILDAKYYESTIVPLMERTEVVWKDPS